MIENTYGLPVPTKEPPTVGPVRPYRQYDSLNCDGIVYSIAKVWKVESENPPISSGPEYIRLYEPNDPHTYMPDAAFLHTAGGVTLQFMHRLAFFKSIPRVWNHSSGHMTSFRENLHEGKIAESAEKETACMEAIVATLTRLLIEENKAGELPLFNRTGTHTGPTNP